MDFPFYVPVMPVLPGDMEGARHVSRTAQRITQPLFVIIEPRRRNSNRKGDFLLDAASRIVDTWRLKGTCFVELYDLPLAVPGGWWPSDHPLVLLHAYLRNRGIQAIPVTATDRKGEYHDAFVRTAKAGRAGIAVRLYSDDLEVPAVTIQKLKSLAADVECTSAEIDLIIDLKRILIAELPTLRGQSLEFLGALDLEAPYRSLTLVGSSLPLNLNGIPQNEDRDVPRLELRLWREVRSARRGLRAIGLGDYAVVRPEYDDQQTNFEHINGKIFYTTEDSTRVVRGESRKKEKLQFQYPKLAGRLVTGDAFSGVSFSWGDARIAACARRGEGYGRPVDWIAFATSHHLELVPVQIEQELTQPA